MPQQKSNARTLLHLFTWLLLAAYMLVLVKFVLLKHHDFHDLVSLIRDGRGFRAVNLVPFRTMHTYFTLDTMPLLRRLGNIGGNIGVFIPLGLLLPGLMPFFRKFLRIVLLMLCISILFESMQYLLRLGSADIDDVILNTVGGASGFAAYRIICKLLPGRFTLFYSVVLCMLILSAGAWIALVEFGMDLNIRKPHESYASAETAPLVAMPETKYSIPGRDADAMGKLVAIKDDTLWLNKYLIFPTEASGSGSGEKMAVVSRPRRQSEAHAYLVTDSTIWIRKDVEQLSRRDFLVEYGPGSTDSVPEMATLQLWMGKDSMFVDTLCYWVQK